MKKEAQRQLLMIIGLMSLISLTLWLWFDSFSFQTYTKIMDEQLCFHYKDIELNIDGFEIYHKNNIIQAGGARIVGLDVLKDDQLIIECQISSQKIMKLEYEINVEKDDQIIYLDYQDIDKLNLDDIQSVQFMISNKRNHKQVYKNKISLKQSKLITYNGSNKDYSIFNAYLGEHWFKAGYFHCIDEEFYKEYPTMIIDYMYLKENGHKADLDDYQRFMHNENTTKAFIEGFNDVYYDENNELKDKEICAVITLQGEKDFVFKIDLNPMVKGEE